MTPDNILKILLVEDSVSDARLLQESIRIGGIEDIFVSVAESLQQAVDHLKNNRVDAVLLDLTLPDSSGIGTVTRFRNACPYVPIVVLTGVDDETTGVAAVRMGVQDYLVKSQTDGRLIARAIRYAIERKKTEEELRKAHDELEARVTERTAELSDALEVLQTEMEERTRVQNALKDSEVKYRELVENANSIIMRRDVSGKITFFNEFAQKFFGFNEKEIIGRNIIGTIVPKTDISGQELGAIIANIGRYPELFQSVENENICKDGRKVWVAWTNKALTDEKGNIDELLCVGNDITERKRAEIRTRITNVLLELFVQKTSRKEYLDSVVEAIRDWSGCRCVGIRLKNPDGFIPYESCVGFSEHFLSQENMLSIKSDACTCIRVATQTPQPQDEPAMTPKGSFYCDNILEFMSKLKPCDKNLYRGICVSNGFKSLAVVPVRYRQEVLGAIHLADEKQNMVPHETVSFLESMAMLVGEAVHRFNTENDLRRNQKQLRLLTAQVSLVEEKERRRIAGDLHDSVGQILAFTARELKTLKKTSPERISGAIGEVCNQLDQAIQQTRSLSFDLSPSILYDLGLEVALEDLTEKFSQERKIQCRFESIPGPKPLAEDVKIFLYRAVRELLINVAKHAHAGAIRILLGISGGEIHITVEDDGVGFDSSQLESSLGRTKGFGIFSIRERLGHIGGRLEIESAGGKGTKVTLVAPLGD